jgi:hypothetical protein
MSDDDPAFALLRQYGTEPRRSGPPLRLMDPGPRFYSLPELLAFDDEAVTRQDWLELAALYARRGAQSVARAHARAADLASTDAYWLLARAAIFAAVEEPKVHSFAQYDTDEDPYYLVALARHLYPVAPREFDELHTALYQEAPVDLRALPFGPQMALQFLLAVRAFRMVRWCDAVLRPDGPRALLFVIDLLHSGERVEMRVACATSAVAGEQMRYHLELLTEESVPAFLRALAMAEDDDTPVPQPKGYAPTTLRGLLYDTVQEGGVSLAMLERLLYGLSFALPLNARVHVGFFRPMTLSALGVSVMAGDSSPGLRPGSAAWQIARDSATTRFYADAIFSNTVGAFYMSANVLHGLAHIRPLAPLPLTPEQRNALETSPDCADLRRVLERVRKAPDENVVHMRLPFV